MKRETTGRETIGGVKKRGFIFSDNRVPETWHVDGEVEIVSLGNGETGVYSSLQFSFGKFWLDMCGGKCEMQVMELIDALGEVTRHLLVFRDMIKDSK